MVKKGLACYSFVTHKTQSLANKGLCAPAGIRTPNLLIRSQMLYPIELRVLF